jgi:putative flippase GtrA
MSRTESKHQPLKSRQSAVTRLWSPTRDLSRRGGEAPQGIERGLQPIIPERLGVVLKRNSNGSAMDSTEAAKPVQGRIAKQILAFAAIGLIGYFIDAGITYLGAKYGGLSPELARPPGFIVATIVNFILNRSITFRNSRAPLFRAFCRYWGVASIGLAVNYAVYSTCVFFSLRAGIAITPAILPLLVAAGSVVAMVLTFVGFRFLAFRP